jgi:twitching motility protein PilI
MSAQAPPFAVLTNIALRSRQLSAGLPERKKTAEQWNGIGFMLAGEHYVVPMGEVTEILHVPRFTQIPGVRPFLIGAANVRGRLLPLVDLDTFFDLPRLAGGYTRNGETWNVFAATELLGDERFLDIAQR